MAVDKLVDSTQLDADLTSVANAIRAKSGGSSQLAFPSGFVSEIGSIQTGGGGASTVDILQGDAPSGAVSFKATKNIPGFAIAGRTGMTGLTIDLSDDYSIGRSGITDNSALQTVHLTYPNNGNSLFVNYSITNCSALQTVVIAGQIKQLDQNAVRGNSNLTAVDITSIAGEYGTYLKSNAFYGTKLNKLILRQPTLVPLSGVNVFSSSPFASGGTGGTIYIPKSLYDHLGDGTANDYKAATNWATIDGYGTITWAKIEGSAYDGYYADGTAIA